MSQALDLWVPAIGAAVVGAALYGYAAWITRRFDRRGREAASEQAPVPALKTAVKETPSQRAYTKAREAVRTRSASVGSEPDSPLKP
jgi:hypothetical protein